MIAWLLDKDNRELLSWFGASALAVIGSVWQFYTWVHERKTPPPLDTTSIPSSPPKPLSPTTEEAIVQGIFDNLSKPNSVPQMVITHHGVNRLSYINQIKILSHEYYHPHHRYHLALPTHDLPLEGYFAEIGAVFGVRDVELPALQKAIIALVEQSQEKIFLLITDFENDTHLLDFAALMRKILDQVGTKLRVVTIGGEKLSSLKTHAGINSYFNYFHLIPITEGVA